MEWVSFDEIKKAVTLRMVIDRYGIRLKQVGPQTLRGRCPLPTHTSEKSRESFTATLDKGQGGAWACQSRSCADARGGRKGGNVLDFVAAMERCPVREAAVKLQQWFSVPSAGPEAPAERRAATTPAPAAAPAAEPQEELVSKEERAGESEEPNKPLAFTLRGIDPAHPYLAGRGITRETAEFFGAGFFPGKGIMSGRVVIPIHNERGELVAYAGRSLKDDDPGGKYKLPPGFHKGQALFNLTRAAAFDAHSPLVIVEGFFDVMKVHQAGYRRVVALMGSSLTAGQGKLLAERCDPGERIVLMLDGDEAGRKGTAEILSRLVARFFVRAVNLPDNMQPDKLPEQQIREILVF
jgi:DNA primase